MSLNKLISSLFLLLFKYMCCTIQGIQPTLQLYLTNQKILEEENHNLRFNKKLFPTIS